ncbi:conserved protein of unknown function (plasmid) [Cupriavidus taiwanensis]|uniref:Uncharacterized protein n=1 Tax=Cupriavidus taiwanensis TaxID=164546 RepID=A0A7Z7NN66_9BURK|nr:conserved protein of unknown function [Cupriavidus taiwanensis]SOZ11336.1 conserved protein of unknown function [Cupriavidus taiwanensis]SOZ42687.1 conserved protein of unknown function [Cupriavidus taiwanensis]SPC21824.1 conserved protein of unknown function [Cupriavidus taiwanensis]SPD55837.1 conserved protein of unknown function [Cupriavidus taiwanensis]
MGAGGAGAPAGPGVWRVGAAVSQFAFGTDSARDSAGRVAVLPAAPGRPWPTQWKPAQEPTNSH